MSASLYESHVTVRCDSPADSERLTGWAAAAGLKLTLIELARGRMRSQPMLTLTGARSHDAARTQAESTAARLRADGFAPVRVKTESAPWAPEVPAEPWGGAQYFEHHVKWNHFVAEYPQHRDDEQMFVDRLVRAVAPTFEGGSQGVGAVHP
ncbi:hypothetical protein ACF1A5_13760 [Streptomyces sp. NPDC014864]|uniref:hypothetical protein n=1 Tax=Streptomyces sp. NPDC014864 TaxID=3364924 RepID=UPI0036FF6198